MSDVIRELETAFLEDHRHLTRGLAAVAEALDAGDTAGAVAAAEAVDARVGPHMLFEERELYPRLRRRLGDEFVERLYQEHGEGLEAVRRLLAAPADGRLPAKERHRIRSLVATALEHALSCGALVSHLDVLAESEQRLLLERLYALRAQGRRWTDEDRGSV